MLANGILLYVVLVWLSRSAADPFDRTLILAGGNLFLAAILVVRKFRGGSLLYSKRTTLALFGWSLAYSITFGPLRNGILERPLPLTDTSGVT